MIGPWKRDTDGDLDRHDGANLRAYVWNAALDGEPAVWCWATYGRVQDEGYAEVEAGYDVASEMVACQLADAALAVKP